MAIVESIELTKDQKNVVKMVKQWFYGKDFNEYPVLRIGGVSGSGKTTVMEEIMEQLGLTSNNTLFVGYTGQSVNRMRQSGIPAKTIHSTFMHAVDRPLKNKKGKKIKRTGIEVISKKWQPVDHISSKIKLVVGDEWSFVPSDLEDLILRYNVPLLVFGDPLQLPPVTGISRFTVDNLDYMMTQIMRQNLDSDIVKLSYAIREGYPIRPRDYKNGDVRFLIAQDSIEKTFHSFKSFFKYSDMTICTTNKQRQAITELIRGEIVHTDSDFPLQGEPLICRKNNWSSKIGGFPLTNGTIGTSMYDVPRSNIEKAKRIFWIDFQPSFIGNDYFDNLRCDVDYFLAPFGNKPDIRTEKDYNTGNKFEFAYALTAHIVQGAEADNVLYIDHRIGDDEFMRRLRYTAVTRAKKYLVYILPHWWR